jgi:hypothetical protein
MAFGSALQNLPKFGKINLNESLTVCWLANTLPLWKTKEVESCKIISRWQLKISYFSNVSTMVQRTQSMNI